MKKIPLTQDKFTIVDDDDYDELIKYKWHLGRDEARTTSLGIANLTMQSFLIKPQKGQIVLHKNGDRLDNRRENLILGTKGMVNLTRGLQSNNSTGYRGVYRYRNGRYGAKIRVNKQVRFLGYYDSPEQAANVYNQAAYEAWGELAPLNDFSDLTKPKDDPVGRKKAYDTKVEKSRRSRVHLGIYKKIIKKAEERTLEKDAQPREISD